MNARITLIKKLRGTATMANLKINGGASPYPKHVGPSAIASFSDGALDAPLKSLKFYIEPSQDLHGYSYPWPAGGGKNLLDTSSFTSGTYNGVSLTRNADGTITLSNTATSTVNLNGTAFLLPAGTYTLSGSITNNQLYLYDQGANVSLVESVNGVAHSFTISESKTVYLRIRVGSGSTVSGTVKPQLESGSTATAYAPYSNICPISGWTQVDGKQSGEDMTDYTPITIQLGQTVYGGTVDALAGKMVIDRVCKTLTTARNLSGAYPGSIIYNASSPETTDADFTKPFICNRLKYVGNQTASAEWKYGSCINANGTSFNLWIQNGAFADLAAATSWLGSNATQICYYLKTPIEVDLTPVSGLTSLLGQNNIWCNTGETELDYYPAAASLVAVQNRSNKVYTSIPLGKIRYETYQITPQQAIDLDSYRAETGTLIRNVVGSKCKLEFNTPIMSDSEWNAVWSIISAGFNNNTEKKLKLRYYDTLSASFKTGYFYVPDVQTQIMNVDEVSGKVMYSEIRVAFIEY